MKKILITIFITVIPFANFASAQWFGEVRGIVPFNSDGSYTWRNNGVIGGETKTAEEDHFGIGLGYKFPNNFSISLNYEKNDTNRIINNPSDTDGNSYDHVTDDLEIKTYMLEVAYNHPVNDNFSVIGLVGIGESKHTVNEFLKFRLAGNDEDRNSSNSRYGSETDTSKRISLGGEYKINDQMFIVGMFTRTDYGESQSFLTNNNEKSWGQKIEEDQFVIGLRYNF
jgi:opacity protein-like surface antigen